METIEKINRWINSWKRKGYKRDIPDEADIVLESENKAPSYRRICMAILKNDVQLLSLGYSRTPCRVYRSLKRAELQARGKIKNKNIFPILFKGR